MISSLEVTKKLLSSSSALLQLAPGGVTIGPASPADQQKGCIAIAEIESPTINRYVHSLQARYTISCVANSLDSSEAIARTMWDYFYGENFFNRKTITQANGITYLVHYLYLTSGPTFRRQGLNYESLMFAEGMFGIEPVLA